MCIVFSDADCAISLSKYLFGNKGSIFFDKLVDRI